MLTYPQFFEEYNNKIELLKERTKKYFQVKANEYYVYKEKPFKIALLNSSFLSIQHKDFSGFNFIFEEDLIKFKFIDVNDDYYEPTTVEEFEFDLPIWLLRDDFEEILSDLDEKIKEKNIELKEKEEKIVKTRNNSEYQQYLKLKDKYEKKGE